MRERPILFSAPMVRAILAGNKTQTRRIVKGAPEAPDYRPVPIESPYWTFSPTSDYGESTDVKCRYGKAGDRLWVRETWARHEDTRVVAYRADGECGARIDDGGGGRIWLRHGGVIGPEWRRPESWRGDSFGLAHFGDKWRPSIFMPRWASRITLEVVSVRIERLHAITEEDAKAEGVEPLAYERKLYPSKHAASVTELSHRDGFVELWKDINGLESWRSNPFVWVVSFKDITSQLARSAA